MVGARFALGEAGMAHHVLDHNVGLADPDLTVTARAAIEPLRDAPDQPGLIALGGDAAQRLAGVGRVA